MRVLVTNCALRGRSGSEIVTIDLASGLRRRGHEVAVFAPLLGATAEILRGRGVIVTDRPEDLPWIPDVIHGQHNHVLATALGYFPGSVGLFVCHSSTYWFDGPPHLTRVKKLCAVDEACRARLVAETGYPAERIVLLTNAVDMDVFVPRAPLPEKPARALLLAKNSAHVAAVREAALRTGLALDEIGSAFGREIDDLHAQLRQYDLVFATARMALEAMAVGCAVVVVDGRGLAGLVTTAVVDAWRVRNFGLSVLTRPIDAATIVGEIAKYDADDATRVSRRIRNTATLSVYLDRVEALHQEIAAASCNSDSTNDLRDTAVFMGKWLRRLGEGMIPENFDTLLAANKFAAEHRAVVEENASLRERNAALRQALEESAARAAAMEAELASPFGALRRRAAAWRGRVFGRK